MRTLGKAMNLDLRRPTIVILGAWNPAIFSTGWCAQYLFGYPKGRNVKVATVLEVPRNTQIDYIDNIGIKVTNERFELYCNEWSENVTDRAEAVCANLLKTLPHTPLGDFGVNFQFVENDPDSSVFDLLETADNLNAHGEVVAKELSAYIKIDERIMLRFLRKVAEGRIIFDFNYNYDVVSKDDYSLATRSFMDQLLAKCERFLEDLYGLSGYQQCSIKFAATGEKAKSDE